MDCPVFRRWRQEDYKVKISVGYKARPVSKNKKRKEKNDNELKQD
jgi:hypothetical protein